MELDLKEQVTNFKLVEQAHVLSGLTNAMWMTFSKTKDYGWFPATQIHTWICLSIYQEHPAYIQDTLMLLGTETLKLLVYLVSYKEQIVGQGVENESLWWAKRNI